VQGLRPDIEIIDDRTMLDRDLGRAPDVIERYLGDAAGVRDPRRGQGHGRAHEPVRHDPVASGGSRRLGGQRLLAARSDGHADRWRHADAGARLPRFPTSSRRTTRRPTSRARRGGPRDAAALADEFEIIIVDDGSKDATPAIADELAAAHPRCAPSTTREPRLRRRPPSGFAAARFDHLAFTDGDRQFKVADIGRLIDRLAPRPCRCVVGYRIQRADPARPDRLRAPVPARQPDLLRPDGHGRRLRLQAVHAGVARGRGGRVRRGVLLGRAADQAARARAAIDQVGVPHYPRTAGSPTGAKPQVVFRAVRDFWALRLRLWAAPKRA
jgi:hypothetical protein